MCNWGDSVPMRVFIPAHLSHTGAGRYATKPIDRCIAPLVMALNEAGIITIASCCGHGREPGRIDLLDGRVLRIEAEGGR